MVYLVAVRHDNFIWHRVLVIHHISRQQFTKHIVLFFSLFYDLVPWVDHDTGDLTGPSFACWLIPFLQLPSACCAVVYFDCCCWLLLLLLLLLLSTIQHAKCRKGQKKRKKSVSSTPLFTRGAWEERKGRHDSEMSKR